MEEFEILGAREWLVDGSNLPSRPEGSEPSGQTHFEKQAGGNREPAFHKSQVTQIRGDGPTLRAPINPPGPPAPVDTKKQSQQQHISNGANKGTSTKIQGQGNNHNGARNNATGAPKRDADAKAAWRTGRPCTGKFRLPFAYGELKQRISDSSKDMPSNLQGDLAFFEEISRRSKAFIAPPKKDTDREISIWGNAEQLRNGRRILSQFLAIYNTTLKKKTDSFAKIMGYSETKEAQLDLIEKNDSILQQLRQRPDPAIILPESMVFLWPGDELPLEDTLGLNLEGLDPLRREFGCHIYIYDEDPNYIRVDAYDHETIITLVHRLRAKWAELMANRHVKIKLYLVQPPTGELLKNEVEVVKLSPYGSRHAYPTPLLYCAPTLKSIQLQGGKDRNRLVAAKNEVRLRDAVETSLQSLRFLRGHVRMRVNFGTFVLDDYRVPRESKPRYSFEEFRSMLFHAKTKGHLIPGLEFSQREDLIAKCSQASDLLAPYSATAQSLSDAEPLYAVNFEFEGENAALLRLEAEFAKSPASGLFEVSQRRWVKPQGNDSSGDKQPPLQVGVIDFESSDWQLEIKALEFHEPDSISQSLRTFSHSIHFSRGSSNGLQGEGRRRVTFSDAAPVARLIEKSALRYRLKGTNYVLEIARYDEYGRISVPLSATPNMDINLGSVRGISEVPVTTWGASVFDLEWDNMLGQHANFRLGYSAEWSPSLNTFFPCRDDPNPADVRKGFHQFMELICRIAVLLGPQDKSDDAVEGSPKPEITPTQNLEKRIAAATGSITASPTTTDRPLTVNFKSWADVVGTAPGR